MSSFYHNIKRHEQLYFEATIKPFIDRFEDTIKRNILLPLMVSNHLRDKQNILVCKTCTEYVLLHPSGRRWANKIRKVGWRRYGKDWYCTRCSVLNLLK